ncbi:MAG: hypothetical protein E7605_08400 [Ruminococcaceae bacterium]|nr:hypothetical protein [Oscillospiraceae bacterium]
MARDVVKAFMSFSPPLFEERHGKGDPRGNVLVSFLGYFFVERQRSNTQNRNSERVPQAQCERQKKKQSEILTTFPTASPSCARSVKAKMPFLCRFTKKWRKKGNSAVPSEASLRARKAVSLSLHSFFRENIRLQLWRARLEKSHAHESNTQRTKTNAFVICDAPQFNKISSKTILLPPSAARVGKMASDAVKAFMSFSQTLFEERHGKGDPRGNVLAPFLATSWGVPRSGIDKTGTPSARSCARP